MAEKTRYTDEELNEFRDIILEKLNKAKKEYEELRAAITNADGNDVTDTSPTFKQNKTFLFCASTHSIK